MSIWEFNFTFMGIWSLHPRICCLAETPPSLSLVLLGVTRSHREKQHPSCWLEISNNILTSAQQFKMNYSAHRSCWWSSQHISAHLLLSVLGGDITGASGKGAHGLGVDFGPKPGTAFDSTPAEYDRDNLLHHQQRPGDSAGLLLLVE